MCAGLGEVSTHLGNPLKFHERWKIRVRVKLLKQVSEEKVKAALNKYLGVLNSKSGPVAGRVGDLVYVPPFLWKAAGPLVIGEIWPR